MSVSQMPARYGEKKRKEINADVCIQAYICIRSIVHLRLSENLTQPKRIRNFSAVSLTDKPTNKHTNHVKLNGAGMIHQRSVFQLTHITPLKEDAIVRGN